MDIQEQSNVNNQYLHETPEGLLLPMEPAGLISRGYAAIIDGFVRFFIYLILIIVFSIAGFDSGLFLLSIMFFLIEWFYPVFFECSSKHATPGKRMMSLQVINEDGTQINFSNSVIRNLLRGIDFLPFMYITGALTTLTNKKFQRLGDLAAGTIVIHTNNIKKHKKNNSQLGKKLPPNNLKREFYPMIVSLHDRKVLLSNSRYLELCYTLQPIFELDTPEQIATEVEKCANFIRGN
ncbi:MAG: RDD family protein [Saccharospirillaceae bacterium]|nr:RDD family protein [Pseudomonadales bacterium]NRB78863.1 RDD family protein [Saccharospirillaceae bacterium]